MACAGREESAVEPRAGREAATACAGRVCVAGERTVDVGRARDGLIDGVAAEIVSGRAVRELRSGLAARIAHDDGQAAICKRESAASDRQDLRAAEGGVLWIEIAAAENNDC